MSTPPDPPPGESTSETTESLSRRLEQLERENQRLREKIEPIFGPDNPCFHPLLFVPAIRRSILLLMLPLWLVMALIAVPAIAGRLPHGRILGIPLVDFAGLGTRHPGLGFGIVSFGGLSVGVVACGGLAVGVFAVGGGAIGLIAIGGGSAGLIAIGGSSVGLIAFGGTATGRYSLGFRAYGKYALGLNRQDQPAINFFTRIFPSLRPAVTNPMPVIPLPPQPGTDT